jgi:signal transduction histidine kinase
MDEISGIENLNDILIVDDNALNLEVLGSMLRLQGYKARPAISGEIALRAISLMAPDLILLDIRMPGINGFETCLRLKANPLTADIPVIFLSAATDLEDKILAFQAGGVDFITKPFQAEEVLARVRIHLQTRQLQSRLKYQNKHLQSLVNKSVAQLIDADRESRRRIDEIAHLNRHISSSVYSAAIAHDLRQPLAAILSNAEAAELYLQQDPPALETVKEILVDIRRDNLRASQIIQRMRSLMNKTESDIQDQDVNAIVQEVVHLLGSEAQLRHVTISLECAPMTMLVTGDLIQLQQIVMNLLINSIEAMAEVPESQRAIFIHTHCIDNAYVEISVLDHGTGFKENLRQAFESFFTTKPQGMGMGLSIISSLIHLHNGQISAEDGPHGGAIVRVRFPLKAVLPLAL